MPFHSIISSPSDIQRFDQYYFMGANLPSSEKSSILIAEEAYQDNQDGYLMLLDGPGRSGAACHGLVRWLVENGTDISKIIVPSFI